MNRPRVLGYRDGMITACEAFALFAIEGDDALRARLGFADNPCIVVTPDIRPSIAHYVERFGQPPEALAFGFAAYLAFMRGEIQVERRAAGLAGSEDREGERIRAAWMRLEHRGEAALRELAREVCSDSTLWGTNLSKLRGWCELVSDNLLRITEYGMRPALEQHLGVSTSI